jgi:L-aspartate oxidase
VYQFTSNPDIATGDGLAMGYRARVPVSNLEFVQFHPTTFFRPEGASFLISEAVRGEGAKLTLPNGDLFMYRYDTRRELAPRDVVARAIDHEMRRHDLEFVYLDAASFDKTFARSRFPALSERCLQAGLSFPSDPIPVVPAAHYMCGGLRTDQRGATAVQGLFACGEVAHTGLHGANRLASNSLLEAVVYAVRVAATLNKELKVAAGAVREPAARESVHPLGDEGLEAEIVSQRDTVRRLMWRDVGIVRSDRGLERAENAVLRLREAVESYAERQMDRNVVELANLSTVAELITRCARWRKESRGLHYNLDHPNRGGRAWRKESSVTRED